MMPRKPAPPAFQPAVTAPTPPDAPSAPRRAASLPPEQPAPENVSSDPVAAPTAPEDTAVPAVPEGPAVPVVAGTYAVYSDGGGGLVLVATDQEGNTHRKRVPAPMLKMGATLLGGRLGKIFG